MLIRFRLCAFINLRVSYETHDKYGGIIYEFLYIIINIWL